LIDRSSETTAMSIGHFLLVDGGPLKPSLYLQMFSRYWTLSVLGSRPWPFMFSWRHRSRDHSISHRPFQDYLLLQTVCTV